MLIKDGMPISVKFLSVGSYHRHPFMVRSIAKEYNEIDIGKSLALLNAFTQGKHSHPKDFKKA